MTCVVSIDLAYDATTPCSAEGTDPSRFTVQCGGRRPIRDRGPTDTSML